MEISGKKWAATVLAALLCGAPEMAQARDCDLALVLALDVSKSMDSREYSLQFEGTAAALRDRTVQEAILAQGGEVALSAFEWSGQAHQARVRGWTMLRSRQDIDAFAAALAAHPRGSLGQHTGTGMALSHAYEMLAEGPECLRTIVDVSSDGYSNDGLSPRGFYSLATGDDITVNALVVGGKSRPVLWRYFETDVIHGPGAFAMATVSFEDYAEVIRDKLLREIAPSPQLAATSGQPQTGQGVAE